MLKKIQHKKDIRYIVSIRDHQSGESKSKGLCGGKYDRSTLRISIKKNNETR
jgi:hypothetical protein